jgi:hypothetical protein
MKSSKIDIVKYPGKGAEAILKIIGSHSFDKYSEVILHERFRKYILKKYPCVIKLMNELYNEITNRPICVYHIFIVTISDEITSLLPKSSIILVFSLLITEFFPGNIYINFPNLGYNSVKEKVEYLRTTPTVCCEKSIIVGSHIDDDGKKMKERQLLMMDECSSPACVFIDTITGKLYNCGEVDEFYRKCFLCMNRAKIRCKLCRRAFYCSNSCSRKDRERHTPNCQKIQEQCKDFIMWSMWLSEIENNQNIVET